MLFDTIWSNVSAFVDENTLPKIVHLSDDLSELEEDVGL